MSDHFTTLQFLYFSDIFHDPKKHQIVSEAMVVFLRILPELSKGVSGISGKLMKNLPN